MDNLNVRDNEAGDAMLQPRSHERRCDPTWSNAAGVSDGHSHQKAQVRDISIGIGAGDSSKAGVRAALGHLQQTPRTCLLRGGARPISLARTTVSLRKI